MATTRQMSVTRALRELKLLKDQIQKLIVTTPVATVVVGTGVVKGYAKNDAYIEAVKAGQQQIGALIAQRNAIKAAIVQANAITVIEVGGRAMSVAEAVERKAAAPLERQWLDRVRNEWTSACNAFENHRANYQQKLAEQQQALIQKGGMRATDDDFKTLEQAFRVTAEPKLLDAMNWREWLDGKQAELSAFEKEVDIALSESNARTSITVTTEV